MITDRHKLKQWFRRGHTPLEEQFASWIDSYWHKEDAISVDNIEHLPALLAGKADKFIPANNTRKDLPQDVQQLNYANSAIKALYIINKPTGTKRIAIHFLNKSQTGYQLGLTLFETVDNSGSVLADTTGLVYEFDKVVPIYDHPSTKNIVAYAYVSLSGFIGAVLNTGQGYSRMPYLLDACFNRQLLISSKFLDLRITDLEHPKHFIFAWGDSITWGSNPEDGKYFTKIIQELVTANGYSDTIVNCGVGGENAQAIPARMGAIGIYNSRDFILPALATDTVEVGRLTNYVYDKFLHNTYDKDNSYFMMLLQGEGRDMDKYPTVNPVMINGVKCKFTWKPAIQGDNSNGVYYLNRLVDAANDTAIKAGAIWHTSGSKFKHSSFIGFVGTNGGYEVKNTDNTYNAELSAQSMVDRYRLMVRKAETSNFVILSPYGGTTLANLGVAGLQIVENALQKEFGAHFINLRHRTVNYGMLEAGLNPTAADNEAISQGKVPPSLIPDGVHPNSAFHRLIGKWIFQNLEATGCLH